MRKAIQIVITLLIVASLILQILVLLGNYRGLRNVNIIRVELNNPAASGGGSKGFFGGLLDKFQDTVDGQIPDFITIALFIICQGDKERETICTPATFGFRYESTGVLDLIQKELSDPLHSTISGIQKGVFILSAAICFFLLLWNFYHQYYYTGHKKRNHDGCCRTFFSLLIAFIALLFAMATFVAQIIMSNLAKSTIYKTKDKILGGLLNNAVVDVQVKSGASVWLSLAAFISLFLVCVLLLFSLCCLKEEDRSKNKRRKNENYEMGPI